GPGIEIYQPVIGPVVHMQVNADLRASVDDARHALDVFRRRTFDGLREFETAAVNDLDATDAPIRGYTVLNSPEARSIHRPSLRCLAEWIKRNHSSGADESKE